jgi:hypothetical protein
MTYLISILIFINLITFSKNNNINNLNNNNLNLNPLFP